MQQKHTTQKAEGTILSAFPSLYKGGIVSEEQQQNRGLICCGL